MKLGATLLSRTRLFVITASLLVGTCVLATPETGSADNQEQIAQEIYGSVMSPFCPARLLNDCPSPSATELKVKILNDLKAGKSREQILEELYATFGSTLRAAPEARGFGAIAWLIPIVFVIGGACIYAVWLKKRQISKSEPEHAESQTVSPEMQQRIQAELSRFDN